MTDTPYDPMKFFDAENAAKAPKTEPQPEPDMTKPETVADYIASDIEDRVGGLGGDPEKIETAIDAARDAVLARYERLAARQHQDAPQAKQDHDQADDD